MSVITRALQGLRDDILRRLQLRVATLASKVARTAPSAARHKGRH
jgi:hypothetical protein